MRFSFVPVHGTSRPATLRASFSSLPSLVACLGLAASLAACSSERGLNGGADDSAGTGLDAGDAGDGDGDGDGDGTILDVGGGTDEGCVGDGCAAQGCQKVDVLFVVDNSPSMYDEQQTLIANVPVFVADMQTALADVASYHIGVITTDNYADEGFLDDSDPNINTAFPACRKLGGLVQQAYSGSCQPFAAGGNFITQEDDLGSKFGCVANVGENGDSDERVSDAIIAAMSPQNETAGECNKGFLRSDALLIVVILTDENDPSDASITDAYASIVARKGSDENVVVLSLVWDSSWDGCEESLSETDGYDVVEFTEKFPNHSVGNICQSSYSGFFSATIPTIGTACDNFIPPG